MLEDEEKNEANRHLSIDLIGYLYIYTHKNEHATQKIFGNKTLYTLYIYLDVYTYDGYFSFLFFFRLDNFVYI